MKHFAKLALACAVLAASATASAKTTSIDLDSSDLTTSTKISVSNFDAGDVFKVTFDLLADTYLTYDLSAFTTSGKGSFTWVVKEDGANITKLVDTVSAGSTLDFSKVNYLFSAGSYVFKYSLANTATAVQNLSFSVAAVPEPETYALMGVGLLGLLAARRRKAMAS